MSGSKRIVICLDGTWQNPYKMRQRDDGGRVLKPTNVLKLSRAVRPRSPDDHRPQITYYDAGIGALVKYPGRANRVLSLADRLLGGVWGAGFEANIEEAFRFLTDNHEPGDEVYLFGFSRGASQARALTNFLSWLGGVPEKGDAYFGPLFFLHWVGTRGAGHPADVKTVDGRRPDRPMDPVDIRLLGVWDTVMALGSRLHTARGTSRSRWSFYVGPRPAGCVRHTRQALAVDERRFDYQPEIFSGCADTQTLVQRWFAGSHSNVGGGYVEDGLANIPFRWLVAEAEALGLAVDHDYVKHFNPYPQGRLYPSGGAASSALEWARLRFKGGSRSLTGHPPEANLSLDRSVIHRIRADPADHPQLDHYRPKRVIESLRGVGDLDAYLAGLGLDPEKDRLPDDVLAAIRS
ncbi:MAG: DUF2235 domain-containing protein [Thermoanaerobaculales bacterium]|jgi:uncharacterized protein (DUF2235 family)|nr:DUF2235 domain-containing protein [Thermoanaerobaculales bacterium]